MRDPQIDPELFARLIAAARESEWIPSSQISQQITFDVVHHVMASRVSVDLASEGGQELFVLLAMVYTQALNVGFNGGVHWFAGQMRT